MKMKYLIIALISIAVTSCGGGFESDVKKVAEKACECDELRGDEKRECKDELVDLSKDVEKDIKDAKLKNSEENDLKKLAKDTYRDCKGK